MIAVIKMIIAVIASLMGCDVPFFRSGEMYTITVYTPYSEHAEVFSLGVNGTYGHVRQEGTRLLVTRRLRFQRQENAGEVKLYVIQSNNISLVPGHCDELRLEAEGNQGGNTRFTFFCVLTDESLHPVLQDWESRLTVVDYSVNVHCLRTGVSRIVKVGVDDRLSDLYTRVRQVFGINVLENGDVLLTSGLDNVPIVIDARPLVRNEVPNGTNLYLRENPLSLARDMRYIEMRFPSLSRRNVSLVPANSQAQNVGVAVATDGRVAHHETDSALPAFEEDGLNNEPQILGAAVGIGLDNEAQNGVTAGSNVLDDRDDNVKGIEDLKESDSDSDTHKEVGRCVNGDNGASNKIELSSRRRPGVRRSRRLQIHISDESSEGSVPQCDATFLKDACCNCRRTLPFGTGKESGENLPYKIGVNHVDLNDLRIRRVFRSIQPALYETGEDGRQIVPICGQCYLHLMARDPDDEDLNKVLTAAVWPNFI